MLYPELQFISLCITGLRGLQAIITLKVCLNRIKCRIFHPHSNLKDAIILLEADQAVKGKLLKEQFFITYETLKPVNLIEHALA